MNGYKVTLSYINYDGEAVADVMRVVAKDKTEAMSKYIDFTPCPEVDDFNVSIELLEKVTG